MILGRPADELAHGHSRPAQSERRGERRPSSGLGPSQPGPARPGKATPLRLGPAGQRPRAGEALRRPVLTGGKPSRWRGQYQRLRHAETQQLGRRRWPGGVTSYLAAAVLSPERKETAALGSYLDDDGCKRTQAKQGG